jgi:hypothetical protein
MSLKETPMKELLKNMFIVWNRKYKYVNDWERVKVAWKLGFYKSVSHEADRFM